MGGMKGRAGIFLALAAIAGFGFLTVSSDSVTTWSAAAKYHAARACEPCYQLARRVHSAVLVPNQVLSWHFYALIGAILLAEWVRPVYNPSRLFARSFFHDSSWFIFDALFMGILMPIYYSFLYGLYRSHLGFLRIDMLDVLPLAAHIVLAILVADFIQWFHHLLRHKVILFWYFHMVHHSQRDMNLFTDLRVHPVERLIEAAVSFIPFLSLGKDVALASFAGWYIFGAWYARAYHSNIRTNLGILRYVMVTPQSHRIHHSLKPEHRDKNFGAIFSIWDHLFGTQYRKYDEYPETGIDDDTFPHETEFTCRGTIRTLFLQLVYPFQLAFRSLNTAVTGKQSV